MATADWVLDTTLVCVLPLLAWRVLSTADLHKAVVLFIGFGMLSALSWTRLGAPDVALVEAAVGTGLTGALLMNAFGWSTPRAPSRGRIPRAWVALLLAAALACLGLRATAELPASSGLRDVVLSELDGSGAAHPVTAVLLNFRGYDTLLEIAVLFAAVLVVRFQLSPLPVRPPAVAPEPLLTLARMLVPGIVLAAGYVLWRGAHAAGGAFQAGALLAGAGILLILSARLRPVSLSSAWARRLLLVGPALFAVVAAAPVLFGGHLLEYPPGWAKPLILLIESALTLSIGLALTAFFPGLIPPRRARDAAGSSPEQGS